MIIVGISGPIGSGKTSFAELLVVADPAISTHLETSTIVMELCNQFNKALAAQPFPLDAIRSTNQLLPTLLPTLSTYSGKQLTLQDVLIHQHDISVHAVWYNKLFEYYDTVYAHPELPHHTILPANKTDYRAIMQWVGGYFLYRLNDPVMWYRVLQNTLRQLPSAISFAALTAPRQPAEADFIRKELAGLIIMMQRPTVELDSNEGTEQAVSSIKPDITVINNGNLSDLRILANSLRADIIRGNYQSVYSAS
jgi:hypothetical protein